METFDIQDLTFYYPEAREPALRGICLSVHPGEFLLLCGPSGSGKSTLLRQLKSTSAPHGRRTGRVLFEGEALEGLSERRQSSAVGFVQQSPENQIVTDKVWHELAFGLESLGLPTPVIRRRVAEMASFFGIESWFYRETASLSGGQKQLVNLASVMVMQPSVLLLDEPTSQLDPIAASDFLAAVYKISRELGTTVILCEHRLEEAMAYASRVAVLDGGKLLFALPPEQAGQALRRAGHGMFLAMPAAMRVWASAEEQGECPVTVRQGRQWLSAYAAAHALHALPPCPPQSEGQAVLEAENVWFRYEKEGPDVLRGLTLSVRGGETAALLGGNGTGKSTAVRVLGGLLRAQRGTVRAQGRVGVLPQNPQTLFVKKTVREDLLDMLPPGAGEEEHRFVRRCVRLCRLQGLLERHPYDLSGGEQQRAALCKVLLLRPDIVLLDEPTKGLDAQCRQELGSIVRSLARSGAAVLLVSHDIEFCAETADRCALLFDGSVAAQGRPREFFAGNSFYTTAANRMARTAAPGAVTVRDLIAVVGGRAPEEPEEPDGPEESEEEPFLSACGGQKPEPLPRWRKVLAAVSGAAAAAIFVRAVRVDNLSAIVGGGERLQAAELALYLALVACLFVLGLSVARRAPQPVVPPVKKGRLRRRTAAAAVMTLLLIPLTLAFGAVRLEGQRYYGVALAVLFECMLPFFLVFEGRRPRARELVLVSVLCALGAAGRAVFFMLPQFKPVMALAIVSGVALGGETGFVVGAVSMLLSNILFGQGPWTPWQMFAMGLVGFLAGILFRKGLLRRTRVSLCVFGALSAVLLYGGIMNPASALIWARTLDWQLLLTYYVTGFPMDCVQAAATALFLWFAGLPMLEKLDRIKVKYGLVE